MDSLNQESPWLSSRRVSSTVEAALADDRKFLADVVGLGEKSFELAVLKVRGASNHTAHSITLSGSPVQEGQRTFAIGNPFDNPELKN